MANKTQDNKPKRWVVCAANRHRESGLIICGVRHYDPLMRAQMKEGKGFPYWLNCDQGFVDQYGVFMDREEAFLIAKENEQIIGETPCCIFGKELFSEDLY